MEHLLHELDKRYNALPRQIYRTFDGSFEIVGIGCTHTYPHNFPVEILRFDQRQEGLVQILDIIFDALVLVGFDGILGQDSTATVDNAQLGVGAAYIDSYDIRFHGNRVIKNGHWLISQIYHNLLFFGAVAPKISLQKHAPDEKSFCLTGKSPCLNAQITRQKIAG